MKTTQLFVLIITALISTTSMFASEIFTVEEIANSYGIKDLEVKPAPVKQDVPVLAGDLRNESGKVYVAFIVDINGNVEGVRCVKSTSAKLTPSVIKAVQKWKFTAGVYKGKAVAVRVVVPVRINV